MRQRWLNTANIACAALALVGYWAPWLAHPAAGLNFNGYELAEWVTFLPAVRANALPWVYIFPPLLEPIFFARLGFLLPLLGVGWLLALSLTRPAQLPLPIPVGAPTLGPRPTLPPAVATRGRILSGITLGLACALVVVPPYPYILSGFNEPEFGWQLGVAGVAGLLSLIFPLLPTTLKDVAQITLALGTLALLHWLLPPLFPEAQALLTPWAWGWGLGVMGLGLSGLALLGLGRLFAAKY